ncbi:MAG: phospholipid-binding protein MlaC [Pseudomonadota bacterium]|jgi:phospholipid transport system substrate-binding protein
MNSTPRTARRSLLALLLLSASGAPLHAQEIAPDALVRSTIDQVIAGIKADKAIQAGDLKRILEFAEGFAQHFNFTRMTRLAMGANWKQASPTQQEALVREFRDLLLRTYAVAMREYRNQTVDVKPVRLAPGQNDVQVRTTVNQPGAQPITIDYDMERTPRGWLVYDVTVAGVSLVVNFRSSFDSEIRKSGVDGLVKQLAERNRNAGTGAAAGNPPARKAGA